MLRSIHHLPQASGDAPFFPASQPDHPANPVGPEIRRSRILLVDDNEDAVVMLAKLLTHYGYDTRSCTSGSEALTAGAEFKPDVVVLDLGMASMDGLETARRLKEETWGRPVLLIALTGWGREDDFRRTLAAGFDRHLVKPLEIDALLDLLVKR